MTKFWQNSKITNSKKFFIGRRCYFTAFAPKAQRPALLFHGLSAEGAKAGVVDTQTPNDPSFIYVLGRFVLKILYLSKPFMGPCDSVR